MPIEILASIDPLHVMSEELNQRDRTKDFCSLENKNPLLCPQMALHSNKVQVVYIKHCASPGPVWFVLDVHLVETQQ